MAQGDTDRRRAALNAGQEETRNLAECLAIDQAALARAVLPALGLETVADAVAQVADTAKALGISRQMAAVGAALAESLASRTDRHDLATALASHRSDTVRSWGAFMVGRSPEHPGLARRLEAMRPFARDPHFGVREWAWLAARPAIAADPGGAVVCLAPWTAASDANERRFAVESTRPRGVWCPHIAALKAEPWLALELLNAVRADPARYVQDSVANWLNDASKSQPGWVEDLCERWVNAPDCGTDTRRIVGRALRTVRKAKA